MDPNPRIQASSSSLRLRSGKTVDLVVLAGDGVTNAPDTGQRPAHGPADLHVCPKCRCDLVQPVDWEPADGNRWQLELACPNCAWRLRDVFDTAVIDDFQDEIERGAQVLLESLRSLTAANMDDQFERFIEAIRADQILPCDF
ncbi:MAG TPA: hypothetical protein VHE14_01860 [Solirubrobacteraceae bacterium]|nr:hypothetical protein [Solirubrobacteraceae bacterium]